MKAVMVDTKQYLLTFLGVVSLLSVIFITSTPDSATAQTITETAATRIEWATGSAQTTAHPAIYTIDYESNNCDSPLGGTLHNAALGTSSIDDAVLGTENDDFTIITTHFNQDIRSSNGANADLCEYVLRVTASLNCSFTVLMGGATVITVNKETVRLPSQGTVRIRGKASTSTTFFTQPVSDLKDASQGDLEWVDSTGTVRDVSATNGVITATAQASSCDAPIRSAGFAVYNAEPFGSLELSVNIKPQSSCSPDRDSGEIILPAGNPSRGDRITLDETCTYKMSVGHSTTQSVDSSTSVKSLCSVVGVLYEVDSGGTLVLSSTISILRDFDNDLSLTIDQVGLFVSGGNSSNDIAQITLFVSASCPQTSSVIFQYELLDVTDRSLNNANITVSITRSSSSHSSCVASPNRFVILEASEESINSFETVDVNIITRPRTGRTCDYVITYPVAEGALTLAAEPGNNFKTGSGTTVRIARPTTGAVPAGDGNLDGVITESSIILRNTGRVSFFYESRKLPIRVSATFPEDVIFTTQDIVDYRITVIGACGEFSEIVANALGGQGTFRSVRAYPGTTLIYDPSLEEFISSSSLVQGTLYRIEPVVIIDGRTIPCTIQVQEANTPPGCVVLGGARQEITFAEGLTEFNFEFIHTCAGVNPDNTGGGDGGTGRGITG